MKPWQLQLKHIAVTMTAFDGSSTTSGNSNTANSNSTNHSLGHGNSNSSSSSYGSHSGSSNNGNCSALSSSGDCGNERCHAEGRGMYSSYHFQKGCLELLAQPGLRYLYQLKPPHNHQDHYPLYHHLDSSSADKIKGRERKEIINAQARSTDGEADKERVRRERLVSESGIFLAIGNAMTKHASLMRLAHTAMSNLFSIINDRHVLPIAPANTAHIDRHQYDHPFHIHDGRAHHSLDPDPGHDVSKITVDFGNSKICSSHRKNNSTNNQTSTPSESDNNKQDKYQSNENDDIHCGNSCRNASSPSSSGNDAAHCGSSLPHYYPYITGPRVRTRSLSLFTLLELLYKDIGVEYNGRKGAAMHRRQKLTIKKSESDDSKYNIRDRDNSAGERMHILGCDSSYAYLSPSLIMALYTYVQSQQEGKRQAEGRSKIAMEVMREMKGIESELLAQKKENTELSTKVVDMQGKYSIHAYHIFFNRMH